MRLHLDSLGYIPATYPKTFYRVSTWKTDRRIADFDSKSEAVCFAIVDSGKGNFDHKVATLHLD